MKRFYSQVAIVAEAGGHGVQLDGKPLCTPGRAPLALPTLALAQAVADEWRGQGDRIDPRTMPMTGLSNAAIDHIAPDPASFAAGIARYGESDLLCYRAEGPVELVDRQAAAWEPMLDWAQARYGVAFVVTAGIMPVAQPPATLDRLAATVVERDPFTLAGLSTLVTIAGSLVCGLAVVEGAFDAGEAWTATRVDEEWQAEMWGEDAEALAAANRHEAEFLMAASFCALVRPR